jgi:adenylosuccinate lyase
VVEMTDDQLQTISPIDGRYIEKTKHLREYFSESALMRYRVLTEIKWLVFLSENDDLKQIPKLSNELKKQLDDIIGNFSIDDAKSIKTIEKETNHDVKAVEYFLQEKLSNLSGGKDLIPFIHFACTSEDINNISYAILLKDACDSQCRELNLLQDKLRDYSHQWADDAMISRTHGQAASPTTMGKEFANFASRLDQQIKTLEGLEYRAKMNGAVGNFNAHQVAYPDIDWIDLSSSFIKSLDLTNNLYTTQIEPHDWMAELFHVLIRINNICLDLSKDIWTYISWGYFKQTIKSSEVGSSTMPHKVNPIDFENAEGNLGLANSILDHLASKLVISRLQRDLSDSTAQRNIGSAFAYMSIAYQSLIKGLDKIKIDKKILDDDLDKNQEILAEAIQTILRREQIEDAYEHLKKLTRGKSLDKETLITFIDSLEVSASVKNELKELSPKNYIGVASKLAKKI